MEKLYENYFFDTEEIVEKDKKYLVLIIYDIVDNKMRVKFAKYLSSYGQRVQKSAFEALLTKKQYDALANGIRSKITNDDNVRIYKITGNGDVKMWGSKETVSEDVIII